MQIETTLDRPNEQLAWNEALARFRTVDAVHDELARRWEDACNEADEATPDRIDRYFDTFKLGIGMKRDDVEFWLRQYVARTGDVIDIAGTADDFDQYQQLILAARERFEVERLWRELRAHQPDFDRARDDLMAVPAPDHEALLIKLQITAMSLDEDHAESTLADAKRLLRGGKAVA